MTRGTWGTNMPERETAVTRKDKEPLTSTAQKGRQSSAAAEQQRTAVVAALVAAEPVAVVGTLRAAPVTEEENLRCKVSSCTGDFHRLKDCPKFGQMDPWDMMALVERLKLCVACLTAGHNQSARKYPYKEERVDACKKPAC